MKYVGEELDLFRHAGNWKRYYARQMQPYIRGRVLDVGAGLCVNAEYLVTPATTSYVMLEPDGELLAQAVPPPPHPVLQAARRIAGSTLDLAGEQFDTILYLDVIEHIEDSAAELRRARDLLAPGGHLIILVPAFNFLFSEFDKAVGHYRRYDKPMLRSELPAELEVVKLRYLDSPGMCLSVANRLFLEQRKPTLEQIRFWDRRIIPLARVLDPLVMHLFGRSLLGVARKPGSTLSGGRGSPA
jgi:SAM-dependent methyltransferase